jgi:ribonucleoside-diphosphate reductase alpha chain
VEVFFNVGKAGSEVAALAEALGRLGSLALRKGATLGGVANQLDGVGGSSKFNKSIAHAISEALTADVKRHANAPEKVTLEVSTPDGNFTFEGAKLTASSLSDEAPTRSFDICPDCHNASLVKEEGCSKCALCGFSAC